MIRSSCPIRTPTPDPRNKEYAYFYRQGGTDLSRRAGMKTRPSRPSYAGIHSTLKSPKKTAQNIPESPQKHPFPPFRQARRNRLFGYGRCFFYKIQKNLRKALATAAEFGYYPPSCCWRPKSAGKKIEKICFFQLTNPNRSFRVRVSETMKADK